jgi:hypothetical protein
MLPEPLEAQGDFKAGFDIDTAFTTFPYVA